MTDEQIDACRENPIPTPPGYCTACLDRRRCEELMQAKYSRMFGLAAPKRKPSYVVIIVIR